MTSSRASSRIGYAVQTHAHPQQISRLVSRLLREDEDCFVHLSHDRTGCRLPDWLWRHDSVHVSLDEGGRGRFHNVARWLDMAEWMRDNQPVDYVVTLTGQDYPVRPLGELHAALESAGDGLVEHFPVLRDGGKWPVREGVSRYTFAWYDGPHLTPAWKRRLRVLQALNRGQPWVRLNVAFDCLRVGTRHNPGLPAGWEVWGGSFFVNLSWRAVERLLHVSRTSPSVMRWARRSLLIEEAFFQTILLNEGFEFDNSTGRFFDFAAGGSGSPSVLGEDDVSRALASGAFFARKWAPDRLDLYDRLDTYTGDADRLPAIPAQRRPAARPDEPATASVDAMPWR